MRSRLISTVACLSLLSACASGPALVGGDSVVVQPGTALPPPTATAIRDSDRPYVIGPLDKLEITVLGIEELSNKEVQTDTSGRISMPLIGAIQAAGRTPQELADAITLGLRAKFVRNPQVAVNLKETVSQTVTVDGEVKEPGLYPVVGGMTLMRAVATAKGVTEFAKLGQVVVFRTVNDQRLAALYDLKQIRRGVYEDPQVYANDVIVVGNSQARRIFRDILQAAPLITTPIVALVTTRNR